MNGAKPTSELDNHVKYAIIIGLAFSITLTLIILRKVIFTPGLIESGDIYFSYTLDQEPLYVWNRFLSSIHVPYHHVVFSWLTPLMEIAASAKLVSASIETLQRLLWSLFFTLISFVIFIVVFKYTRKVFDRTLPCYAAAILASIIYTFNPYVVGTIQWWPNLLSYALLPLFFILIPAAVNDPSWKGTVKIGLAPALLLALNFCSPGAALNTTLFILFLIAVEFISKIRKGVIRYFFRCSVLLIEIVGLALLLNIYAILPFSLFQEEYTWGGQNIPLQVEGLYGAGGANIKIWDAFRLWKSSVIEPFALNTRSLLTLVVPVIATSALTVFIIKALSPKHFSSLKKIDKKTLVTITLLILLALFLAKGINEPFGDFYIWLVFSTPFSWLFEHSEVWIRYLCLAYAFLCSLLLAQLVNRIHSPTVHKKYRITFFKLKRQFPQRIQQYASWIWNSKTVISIIAIIIFSVSVRTATIQAYQSSLFLGDGSHVLRPSVLPQPYYDVNDWFSNDNEEFRTIWLPISGTPTWWVTGGHPPHPIGDWASSRPIATTNHPSQKTFMSFTLDRASAYNKFAELLGIFNVKYVINHQDTYGSNDKHVYEILKDNPILRQVYNNDFLYVFENEYFQSYVRTLNKAVVCISNLRALDLSSTISTFNMSNLAIIFPEQLPGLGMDALKHLTNNDLLLFFNKPFTDLLFNSLSGEYIHAPSSYLRGNVQWRVEDREDVMKYEFDYGKGYVYSLEKRPFSFKIDVKKSCTYEAWARVLGWQRLTLLINDFNKTVAGGSESEGFTWVKLGELMLNEGNHELTIINDAGWGNINLIAVVPVEELENKKEILLDYINESNTRIVNIFDEKLLGQKKSTIISFQESFDDISEKTPPWLFSGNWTITDIDGNKVLSQLNENSESTWIRVGNNLTMMDGFFEVNIKLKSGSVVGVTREQQQGQSYIFTYTGQDKKLIIWKTVDQDIIKLGEADFIMDIDQWYNWRLEIKGPQISLYVNGTRYIDTVDEEPPYEYGQISLHTSSTKADFDNVKFYDFVQFLNKGIFKDSEYILALRTVGGAANKDSLVYVDGKKYSLVYRTGSVDSEWKHTPPINLTQGQHRISIPYQVNEKIKQLVVFSISKNEEIMTVDDIFKGETMNPIIEYEKLEAEEYTVKVNSSNPFILAFSETYHGLWQASTDDLEYQKVPLYSQINGFFINKTGSFTIKIEFLPSRAHYLGETISTLTLLSMFISYIFLEDHIRRNLMHYFKKIKDMLLERLTPENIVDK